MNVMSFAQEFSNLVIRYTKEPLNPLSDSKQPTDIPLTKQEVTNVVNNVLATLLGISDTSFKTPTTGIAVATPTAPTVDNINKNENDGNTRRFRSRDIQETPKNSGTSSPDLRIDDMKEKTILEVFQDGKKFISRSSPAICVNNIGRSDTFVLDENQLVEATTDLKKFNDTFPKTEAFNVILRLIQEARMSTINVIAKLDEIKEKTLPPPLSARRLSTNDITPSRTSSVTRLTIPVKVRRSISDFPRTPTSSRSLTTGSQDTVDKRKNPGATSADNTTRKFGYTEVTRSISNLHLSSNNKSSDSINKPTKNPKYAHVQSTIPKPISSKRKL